MSANNTNTTLNVEVIKEENDIGFGILLLLIVSVGWIVPNLIACIARTCKKIKKQQRNIKELESRLYVTEDI